ncbi:MAG: RNA polymerase sigma factor [Planctomycetota bacterium]|jgi:RNA polymerase sigma-70 factor (ECF subfamily)
MKDPSTPDPREFATTHWSLVLAANLDEASRTRARKALEELCRAYWYPLYAFVRYRGYSPDDAQDLTQSFFTKILETGGFASADPDRGRFRSYLLGAMKHFLANEWHRSRTQKRGGGVTFLDLDALDPEARYALEPAQSMDPDAGFDREWAQESIARAMEKLRAESNSRGKGELFEALKGSLIGDEPDRKEIAGRLEMTDGAVKAAVHRLRQRFRELLRAEIAETVADPSDVDAEMRLLKAALRKK